MSEPKKNEHAAALESAVSDQNLPNIYFNGFTTALGTGDVVLLIKKHGKAVALLNTSYTVAKTLAQKLTELVQELERLTGNTIMTTNEIESKMKSGSEGAK